MTLIMVGTIPRKVPDLNTRICQYASKIQIQYTFAPCLPALFSSNKFAVALLTPFTRSPRACQQVCSPPPGPPCTLLPVPSPVPRVPSPVSRLPLSPSPSPVSRLPSPVSRSRPPRPPCSLYHSPACVGECCLGGSWCSSLKLTDFSNDTDLSAKRRRCCQSEPREAP